MAINPKTGKWVADRKIPSRKRLIEIFPEVHSQLRQLLEDWKNRSIKSAEMMQEANGVLGGHGVEHLESINERAEAYYVNMGDTYNATILLDIGRNRVWATDWGSWLEAEEKRGNRFA